MELPKDVSPVGLGTLDVQATLADPHHVAQTLDAVSQEVELHSAAVLMTLSLMAIPSMAANHNVPGMMTALMTTVAKEASV